MEEEGRGLLEVHAGGAEEECPTAATAGVEELQHRRRRLTGLATTAAVAGSLLLLAAAGVGLGARTQGLLSALPSHLVRLSAADEQACEAFERALASAAEKAGMETLKGLVLRKGCAVNETSQACFEEKERIAALWPNCGEGGGEHGAGGCAEAQWHLDLLGENISIVGPKNRQGERPPALKIKRVSFRFTRRKKYPAVCEARLKRFLEGDGSSSRPPSVFHSVDFCKLNLSGFPVPHTQTCSSIASEGHKLPCNRMERLVGHKLLVHKVSFVSSCHSKLTLVDDE